MEPHDPRGVPARVPLPSGSIHAARLLEGLSTAVARDLPDRAKAKKTHFHQISTQTGHRLRQQMVDEDTGRAVDAKHKGRGYELTKGKYVQIDEDELKAIQVESTHTIDIDGFAPRAEIDKRYLDRPYYIAPNGKKARRRLSSSATRCRTRSGSRSHGSSWRTGNT